MKEKEEEKEPTRAHGPKRLVCHIVPHAAPRHKAVETGLMTNPKAPSSDHVAFANSNTPCNGAPRSTHSYIG